MSLTQQEMMRQYQREETLKIADLDLDNHPENIKVVQERLALYEAIVFEAKSRATEWHRVSREIELKNWDKKITRKTLKDPRLNKLNKEATNKAVILTKLESIVHNYVTIGWADKEILDYIPSKFDRAEVWKAIYKSRGTTEPVLTEEQKQGIAEEEAAEEKARVEREEAKKAAVQEGQ